MIAKCNRDYLITTQERELREILSMKKTRTVVAVLLYAQSAIRVSMTKKSSKWNVAIAFVRIALGITFRQV